MPTTTVQERHLVRTDAGHVHLRITGSDTAGPELLLLHQVPASGRIWLPVMAELAPLPCVAPDMLNLGESDGTDPALTLEEHAEHLWQAVQRVRPGPKVVAGHHTGAALARIGGGTFVLTEDAPAVAAHLRELHTTATVT